MLRSVLGGRSLRGAGRFGKPVMQPITDLLRRVGAALPLGPDYDNSRGRDTREPRQA
jgi:hypothetical protein